MKYQRNKIFCFYFLQTGEEPSALALANFLNLKLNLNGLAIPHWYCHEPRELLIKWLEDFQVSAQQYTIPTKVNSKFLFKYHFFLFRFYV